MFPTIKGFHIEARIGGGSWAEVFRARDLAGQLVAIKLLRAELIRSAEAVKRFLNEAEQLETMFILEAATNVVAFQSNGLWQSENGPRPYIVLEYVAGGSVRDLLNQEGHRIDVRRACEIVRDASLGAACVQRITHGVHRDIKPENILLDSATAKLSDLGIWRLIPSGSAYGCRFPAEHLTAAGVLVGTRCYAAPEVEEGRASEIGFSSDVYSLGVTLFELLTGQLPPRVDAGGLYSVTPIPPPPPSEIARGKSIPTDLDTVCRKCLAHDPKGRYQTAKELLTELERVITLLPVTRPPYQEVLTGDVASRGAGTREEPSALRFGWMRRTVIRAAVVAVAIVGTQTALRQSPTGSSGDQPISTPSNENPRADIKAKSTPGTPLNDPVVTPSGMGAPEIGETRVATAPPNGVMKKPNIKEIKVVVIVLTEVFDKKGDTFVQRDSELVEKGETGVLLDTDDDSKRWLIRRDNPSGDEIWIDARKVKFVNE